MDERTRDLLDYAILWLSFGLLVLAIVGEVLGWWNDLGIVLTVASLVGTVYAAFDIYGRKGLAGIERVVDGVRGLQTTQQSMLVTLDTMAENQDAMLENQDAMLGKQDVMIQNQDAMLEKEDAMLGHLDTMLQEQDTSGSRLDRIQDTLDRRLPDGA